MMNIESADTASVLDPLRSVLNPSPTNLTIDLLVMQCKRSTCASHPAVVFVLGWLCRQDSMCTLSSMALGNEDTCKFGQVQKSSRAHGWLRRFSSAPSRTKSLRSWSLEIRSGRSRLTATFMSLPSGCRSTAHSTSANAPAPRFATWQAAAAVRLGPYIQKRKDQVLRLADKLEEDQCWLGSRGS